MDLQTFAKKKSRLLRHLLLAGLAINTSVLLLDYATRNSGDSLFLDLADILTVVFLVLATVIVLTSLYVLVRLRGKLMLLDPSTYILFAAVIILVILTFPIEEWITSQSYRRGG